MVVSALDILLFTLNIEPSRLSILEKKIHSPHLACTAGGFDRNYVSLLVVVASPKPLSRQLKARHNKE